MPHPLQPSGLRTHGIPSRLLSPGVPLGFSAALQSVCQALACSPIESSKRGITALSCCDVAQETLKSESTNIPNGVWAAQWACGSSQLESTNIPNRISTRTQSGIVVGCATPSTADQLQLPGLRNGLVGHRSWSSTNISQLHLHKLPERCRVSVVRSTNIRTFASTVIRHNAATPQKGTRGFGVPEHATREKTVHVPVPFAPLSLTRLDSFPDPCFGPPTKAHTNNGKRTTTVHTDQTRPQWCTSL